MTATRISMFGGIVPRIASRGLPANAAQYALNAKLTSGELRSWNGLRKVSDLPFVGRSVFHFRVDGEDHYLGFDVPTEVVKAPLVNEQIGRIYWTNETGVFVNTAPRILNDDPPFKLGVPPPTGTFTVDADGGTGDVETRAYTVTLVTAFGEESMPAVVVSANGAGDATWTVSGLDELDIDTAGYPNITHLRLYRTLSSDTGTDYRLVSEWEVDDIPASWEDTVTPLDAADAPPMQSLGWTQPPAALRGLVSVAGGFLAGFVGRDVRLSVPYYPHAWPEDFTFSVEDTIVALATFGNYIAVLTEGRAALLLGMDPESMTLTKLDGIQPCLSPRSVVNSVAGVMYASTDGLVLVDGSTSVGQIVSRGWVTKDEWLGQFSPKTHMAAMYQDRYLAFYSSQLGMCVGFDDPVTGYTELQVEGVTSVDTDTLTGQTLVTLGTEVFEWDSDTAVRLRYVWRSKPFLHAKPLNFGALQIRGTFIGSEVSPPVLPPLPVGGHTINSTAIGGGVAGTGLGGSINGPATWELLSSVVTFAVTPAVPAVLVRLFVDGRVRWTGRVSSEAPVRLPSGYKGVRTELELSGQSDIFSATLAETMRELEELP